MKKILTVLALFALILFSFAHQQGFAREDLNQRIEKGWNQRSDVSIIFENADRQCLE